MKLISFWKKAVPLLIFISLEIILFIASDFGAADPFLKIVAIVLAILILPAFWKQFTNDLGRGLYVLIMPLLFYGLVIILSPSYVVAEGFQNTNIMGYTLLHRIINFIGLIAIILLGYFLRNSALFSAKYVYLVVFAGFAFPILISLFATLIHYGFFHTLLYRGQVLFYAGKAYSVSEQVSYLVGFDILTVNTDVLTTGALLISSVGLILLIAKNNITKYEKIILGSISAIGLLTIILIGAFTSLIYLIPAIAFVLLLKFNLLHVFKKKEVYISILSIVGVGALVFVITAFNLFNIQSLWSATGITRKLLMNGYMQKFYFVFKEAITFNNLYGSEYVVTISQFTIFPTGNFLFDVMWMDGLFGFLALFIFLIMFIRLIVINFKSEAKPQVYLVALVCAMLTIFSTYMLNYPYHHYIFAEMRQHDRFPLITSSVFLVVVFFAGYLFQSKEIKEVK